MKVADIMRQPLFMVTPDTPLAEVRRIILSIGISEIPVTDKKKLVGVIHDSDILDYFYPGVQEILEKASSDEVEEAERKASILLSDPAKKVMKKSFITISPETSLADAHKLMHKNSLKRISVTDSDNNLIGVIIMGDIFRVLMGDQIAKHHERRYVNFIAENYDAMLDWESRFEHEMPAIERIFTKKNVKSILDIGCWTGEYVIEFVKRGYSKAVGLDLDEVMVRIGNAKKEQLPEKKRENVEFIRSDFTSIVSDVEDRTFDAVLCVGNALPYIPISLEKLFSQVYKTLNSGGVFLLQVKNFQKSFTTKNKLLSFKIEKSKKDGIKEQLFLEFIEKQNPDHISHNVVSFDNDGKFWTYKGFNTINIKYYVEDEIEDALKKAGFQEVLVGGNRGGYQGDYGQLSFVKPFDPEESDWLNIVAKKK